MSRRYDVIALSDLWRRSSFSNGATANRRKRIGRKCQCEAGLNQQALSAQVEANRWRGGVVLARREVCRVGYCCESSGNRYIDCEPFRVDAICWRSCIGFINRRSCIKGVAARRAGAMVRAFGLRFAGVVCRLCGRGCLRNVTGVVAESGGKRLAAWKKRRVEPERRPGQHQDHAREPVRNAWLSGLRHPGETSR